MICVLTTHSALLYYGMSPENLVAQIHNFRLYSRSSSILFKRQYAGGEIITVGSCSIRLVVQISILTYTRSYYCKNNNR